MANQYLLKSVIFFGGITLLFIIHHKIFTLLSLFYAFGIFTSLWNHGSTSDKAKWCDRISMFVGIFIDFSIIVSSKSILWYSFLLATPVALYLTAKKLERHEKHIQRNLFHSGSHFFLTVLHINLIVD